MAARPPRIRNTGKRSGQQEAWYSDAPPRIRDGAIHGVKTWQRLPSELVEEWCVRRRRPGPLFLQAKSFQDGSVLRFRVILPDPDGDTDRDLVFCPFESVLKTKHACVAREEAALVAYFLIFTSPDLSLARAEPRAGGGGAGGYFRPTVSSKLWQTEDFAAVIKVLPDPWKGYWVSMGKGEKGCLQAERWFASEAAHLEVCAAGDAEAAQQQDEGKESKKRQPELVILNPVTRAQETSRELEAQQAVQELCLAKDLRRMCIRALRANGRLSANEDGLLAEYEVRLEEEERLETGRGRAHAEGPPGAPGGAPGQHESSTLVAAVELCLRDFGESVVAPLVRQAGLGVGQVILAVLAVLKEERVLGGGGAGGPPAGAAAGSPSGAVTLGRVGSWLSEHGGGRRDEPGIQERVGAIAAPLVGRVLQRECLLK